MTELRFLDPSTRITANQLHTTGQVASASSDTHSGVALLRGLYAAGFRFASRSRFARIEQSATTAWEFESTGGWLPHGEVSKGEASFRAGWSDGLAWFLESEHVDV